MRKKSDFDVEVTKIRLKIIENKFENILNKE